MDQLNLTDGPFAPAGTAAVSEFPEVFGYAEARATMWSLPESEFLLGVDGAVEPVTVDLKRDTPHVLVSAGSGAGKSVVARSMATQALVKGAHVAFLDVKLISHRWAKSLPGVDYAAEIHEIANVLVSVGAEIRRRNKIIEAFPGDVDDALADEPRIIIVVEEINSMMEELREFERSLPPRGVYKPTRAFGDIMNMGRAAKVHVFAVGQYVDGTVIPKRWRESFGYKVLIRPTADTWRMLAWQAGYPPPVSQHPGRGYLVNGERAVQVQYLYLTDEECAALVRELRAEAQRVGMVAAARRRMAQSRALRELEG